MIQKGKGALILLTLLSFLPGVLALPFSFELIEQYESAHMVNLFPCWSSWQPLDLGGVFPVYKVGKIAGYYTGVSSHKHFWDGGIALYIGNTPTPDGTFTVGGRCAGCGYIWYEHSFDGKLAGTIRICGGDDNGGKRIWGGLGGYQYWVTLNKQSHIGSVDRLAEEKKLGKVSDFFDEFSALKGQPGWTVTVASPNPQVILWVGGPADTTQKSTTNVNADVWACADTDQNQQCDAYQAQTCLTAGGDWYKGICCGTQVASCGYVPSFMVGSVQINLSAICGKSASNKWEWAPRDEPGQVHPLLACPGGSVVSDGTAFYSCGDQLAGTTQAFGQFRSVTIAGKTHDYYCAAKNAYECGGMSPFSTVNARVTGDTTAAAALSCPTGMVAYWDFNSNNAQDVAGSNHGTVVGTAFGPGPVGNAAVFDGSNDRIEVPSSAVLSPSAELTVEAWINPASVSGTRTILNKGNSYELVIEDGVLKGAIQRTTGGTWSRQGTGSIPASVWSHVAMTYNGAVMNLYINGVLVNNFTMTGTISPTTLGLFIGGKSDALLIPYAPFHGSMDEVAVSDKAFVPAEIATHAGTPASYCATTTMAETYYCASDGDWTTDLDAKDVRSCDAAGFKGSGTYCCSEADDPAEYYNDPLGVPPPMNVLIPEQSGAEIITGTDRTTIILDQNGDWVKFNGPVRLRVDKWSQFEEYAGIFKDCELLESRMIEVPAGRQRFAANAEPGQGSIANPQCIYRKLNITVEALPGRGGCWNKIFIESGQFAVPSRVINYRGQFYGCRITDPALLDTKDTHTDQFLINNSIAPCGYVLNDAIPGGQAPHAVCRPDGLWGFTDELVGTIEKSIAWSAYINLTGISQSGCCGFDNCWNGTKCQSLGSYYRIGDQGFVCTYQ
jgi:hypothetical protein